MRLKTQRNTPKSTVVFKWDHHLQKGTLLWLEEFLKLEIEAIHTSSLSIKAFEFEFEENIYWGDKSSKKLGHFLIDF